MKLTIYADETFATVREVREVPRMKIPYRAAEAVTDLLSDIDLSDDVKILNTVLKSTKEITAVVQATFALSDEDLRFVDVMELGDLAKEIIGYVLNKMAELGIGAEGDDPNARQPATT